MTYRIAAAAEKDLDDIIEYFLPENRSIATTFIDSFYKAADMLAENPKLGHRREDLMDKTIRVWPFKWHYLILYTDETPIKIVRVLSGYRDVSGLLGKIEMTSFGIN